MSAAHMVTHHAHADTRVILKCIRKIFLLLGSKNKTNFDGTIWQKDPMYYTLFILFVAKCTVNGDVGGLSGCIAINGHSVCFYKTYLNDLNMTYYSVFLHIHYIFQCYL